MRLVARRLPALLFAAAATCAAAAPFTPANDADVVEKLPGATDPAARSVDSLRKQLAARPADVTLRLEIARRYFDLAMAQGDPRYVGYASAAIAPLEKTAPANPRYWLVRGLIQQYSHDFGAALASLARSSQLAPASTEPISWRAAIYMVQAQYQQAEAECRRLTPFAHMLLARGCAAYAQAATGQLRQAYEGLQVLALSERVSAGLKLWVYTRLGEMAVRLHRWEDAERHFSNALNLGITDQFLLAAYADFMLQRGRPAEAVKLLEGWERSDALLLRLALAGRAANDPRAAAWTQQLRERFADAARRGDRLHEQEAARFALDIEGDAATALRLAASNYARQKEPRDAEILMRAALAAGQGKAAQEAVDWLRTSGFEDATLAKLSERLVAAGASR